MQNVVTIILAGGKGERLYPLTKHRAKPAVPFGGEYRIIDFTLSNCINSYLRQIYVLTQYKSFSLHRHIRNGWQILPSRLGEFIEVLPPQMRIGQKWYQGTADAIYQNLYSFQRDTYKDFLILAGDHVYKMDYRKMVEYHRSHGAGLTVGVLKRPKEESREFGVMEVDGNFRVCGFSEKPDVPVVVPGDEDTIYASMGIYVFSKTALSEQVTEDAKNPNSDHDFGKNIIPQMVAQNLPVYAFPFQDENDGEQSYWRDVGTIDAFYEACIDMVSVHPLLNLYSESWPIHTFHGQNPPAKFVHDDENRRGLAIDSIISNGCIISGSMVRRCVLSRNVRVNSYSEIDGSIIFSGVDVGRGCKLRNVIVDRDTYIPHGTEIGYDAAADATRFTISEGGRVVVTAEDFPGENSRSIA